MKRMHIFLTGILSFGALTGSVAAVNASSSAPERPAWVTADGRADLSRMPDDVQIPYQCWNGKTVMLAGKTVKQKQNANPLPGSAEHTLGMDKVKELQQVSGAVTADERGGIVIHIDESDPEVAKIMEKYEAKETPECK